MANAKIRQAAKTANVPLWKIADRLGVADATLSRWLRHEFSEDQQAKALAAIDEIAAEMVAEDEN